MKLFVIIGIFLILLVIFSGCVDTVNPNITDVNYFVDDNKSSNVVDANKNNLDNNLGTITPRTIDFNNFQKDMDACIIGCKSEEMSVEDCSKKCFNEFTAQVDLNDRIKAIYPCLNICRKNGGQDYLCNKACREMSSSSIDLCTHACVVIKKNPVICLEECKKNPLAYDFNAIIKIDQNIPVPDNNYPLTPGMN